MSMRHVTSGVLISLRPRFAEAILEGQKDVELRRQPTGAQAGDMVLIYSSSPVKAAVGWARVHDLLASPVDRLWATHGPRTGVTQEEYYAYFDGLATAHGLILGEAKRIDPAMSLAELRDRYGVHPPQSWRYLPASLTHTVPA